MQFAKSQTGSKRALSVEPASLSSLSLSSSTSASPPSHRPTPTPSAACRRTLDNRLGLRVSYLEACAAGTPRTAAHLVLLVHGFPDEALGFEAVLGTLAAAGLWAVAPDARGTGDTTATPSGAGADAESFSVSNAAQDLAAFMVALGCGEGAGAGGACAALVGHDAGAFACVQVALAHPGLVRAVVSVSAAVSPQLLASQRVPQALQAEYRRLRAQGSLHRHEYMALRAGADASDTPVAFLSACFDSAATTDAVPVGSSLMKQASCSSAARVPVNNFERRVAALRRNGGAAVVAWHRSFVRGGFAPALLSGAQAAPASAATQQRFCYVVGADDQAAACGAHRVFHQELLRGSSAVLRGVGHYPALEKPEAFSACLIDFLRGGDGRCGAAGSVSQAASEDASVSTPPTRAASRSIAPADSATHVSPAAPALRPLQEKQLRSSVAGTMPTYVVWVCHAVRTVIVWVCAAAVSWSVAYYVVQFGSSMHHA